jgi:hypothetical protein
LTPGILTEEFVESVEKGKFFHQKKALNVEIADEVLRFQSIEKAALRKRQPT